MSFKFNSLLIAILSLKIEIIVNILNLGALSWRQFVKEKNIYGSRNPKHILPYNLDDGCFYITIY